MRRIDVVPTISSTDAGPDAKIGTLVLQPIVDRHGAVVDHMVVRAAASGPVLLFGDMSTMVGRRVGELDGGRAQLAEDLLARVADCTTATVDLRLLSRVMRVHLAVAPDSTLSITFARVDARTDEPTGTEEADRIARLHTMMATLSDGVAMYEPIRDPSGEIVDFLCLEMSIGHTVIPPEEQIGRRALELFPELRDNGLLAGYVRTMTTGEPWTPEPMVYQRDGRRYVYRIRAVAVDGKLVVAYRDTLVDDDRDLGRPRAAALTDRQLAILQSIADGRTTAEIAATLFLSPFTVRNEVRRILTKLDVGSRPEAVRVGLVRGIITDHPGH